MHVSVGYRLQSPMRGSSKVRDLHSMMVGRGARTRTFRVRVSYVRVKYAHGMRVLFVSDINYHYYCAA